MKIIDFGNFKIKCDYDYCTYFKKFPEWRENAKNYEIDTFKIIKKFSGKNNNFIDIGGWYGFMSIFASKYYNNIITVEGDSGAISGLKNNLKINSIDNVSVYDKVLHNFNGEVNFGGNGDLGNSESTVLINDENYLTEQKAISDHRFDNESYILSNTEKNECSDFKSFLDFCNNLIPCFTDQLSLIKMDVEGSEKVIVPQMLIFFNQNKHVSLFISLHWIFLTINDIKKIINHLDKSFSYIYDKNLLKITTNDIIIKQIHDILFTNEKII